MLKNKDIKEIVRKDVYAVPDNYFEGLKSKLSAIPSESESESVSENLGLWQRTRPYFALAAMFLFIAVLSNIAFNKIGKPSNSEESVNDLYYSMLASSLSCEDAYYQVHAMESETVSDEDVLNYLLESRTSSQAVGYYESYLASK